MFNHMIIDDFAIIKHAEFQFGPGLNIITGETGSGKSIVVEAMSLVLGSRADTSFIRHGAGSAKVQLSADSDGSDIIISRELSKSGKNLCKINDDMVTKAKVKDTASKIADIHGQYDNRLLLDDSNHRKLLDAFAGEKFKEEYEIFSQVYKNYKNIKSRLEKILTNEQEMARRADFYRFECNEIREAELQDGEDEELQDYVNVLKNSEKIFRATETASEHLTEGDCDILSQMGRTKSALDQIRDTSKETSSICDDFDDVYYELQDISSRIRDLVDSTDFDQSNVDRAISRLDLIQNLKKKYGKTVPEILEYCSEMEEKISEFDNADFEKAELEKEASSALLALKKQAGVLSEIRKETAINLSKTIENELHDLNFKGAKLEIRVTDTPVISSSGSNDCEIYISTNQGEPLKPLSKTASGGEISRIMLAIKNVTGTADSVPTMIFDEIDTGISGITASVVARKLKQISKTHQIICITHLPQIAAAGDVNFRISKNSEENRTFTSIERLSAKGKLEEISRLLGGDTVTDRTLESAEDLIRSMV